jgi:2-oxoglutarate dehydrogenase E2 component (dihydrolipoamide succinyltransferase)
MLRRRKVAERLVAKNETAMLTTFNEVNMTPINLIVINIKMSSKQNTQECGLGYMSFLQKRLPER